MCIYWDECVAARGLYSTYLCVAHSELHLGKLFNSFNELGGGAEVFMVLKGDREVEVKSSHSLG